MPASKLEALRTKGARKAEGLAGILSDGDPGHEQSPEHSRPGTAAMDGIKKAFMDEQAGLAEGGKAGAGGAWGNAAAVGAPDQEEDGRGSKPTTIAGSLPRWKQRVLLVMNNRWVGVEQ